MEQVVSRTRDVVQHVSWEHNRFADALATMAAERIRRQVTETFFLPVSLFFFWGGEHFFRRSPDDGSNDVFIRNQQLVDDVSDDLRKCVAPNCTVTCSGVGGGGGKAPAGKFVLGKMGRGTVGDRANGPEDIIVTEMLQELPIETVHTTTRRFQSRGRGECDSPASLWGWMGRQLSGCTYTFLALVAVAAGACWTWPLHSRYRNSSLARCSNACRG